ncbi:tyrosine-protein phosphatase [Virgibacillus byunsanensis]|uniref:protein-tyrosine-phosphatase n=1 Tax=Virgibacillus byunsanensis TaxID=570945 RepID=A0ABW3LHD2_9BACI
MDDGSQTLTESLAIERTAAEKGIHKIIATPHHNNGVYIDKGSNILGLVGYLNVKLQEEGIPIEILPGQETRIYGGFLEGLTDGSVLPLNIDSGYVFIELPTSHVPQYAIQLLFDIQIQGYKPIIVHPERNQEIMENPNKLYLMVKNGALT